MYKSIVLSTCLYGSVYIFCTSLTMINMTLLKKRKVPRELILLNGLTFISSGFIFLHISVPALSRYFHKK
jgi:hypothetical protein